MAGELPRINWSMWEGREISGYKSRVYRTVLITDVYLAAVVAFFQFYKAVFLNRRAAAR
jgi:hypothetical protein